MIRAKRAEMGVGTLIIFIALLLVAAVAAGVLIQTAGSLQQRALSTGAQATGQISTAVVVIEVSGVDGTNPGGVSNFSYIFKLAPGSDALKLDDVTFFYASTSESITFNYRQPINSTAYCPESTVANGCTQVSGGAGNFTVEYLQRGPNSQDGVLVRGDVGRLHFSLENNVTESQYVRLNFIPRIGTPTLTEFDAPDVISTQRVYFYPDV